MEIQRGERFLKVYEFMISDLGLSGVQLLLFARIFGFSAPEAEGCFYESRARTAEGATTRPSCSKAQDRARPASPSQSHNGLQRRAAPL